MEYDELDAISYIKSTIGINIDNDVLLNIIDFIWDYYEENNMLDITFDDDTDSDEELLLKKLVEHTKNMIKKNNGINIDLEIIDKIILAELQYEKTLEEF